MKATWLIFGVLFLLISSHPVLSQPWPKGIMCPKCLQFRSVFVGCETFSKLSRWGYDAVGRALAGHFALANWLLGIRLNAQWRKFSPQPLSHSATLSDWVAASVTQSGWVAEWLTDRVAEWLSGWVAGPATLAEWLSCWVAASATLAEWLSGCVSHSGRVAEWLRQPLC